MATYSKDGNLVQFIYSRGAAGFISPITGEMELVTPETTILYSSEHITQGQIPNADSANDPTIKAIESKCPKCSKPIRSLILSIDAFNTFLVCRCGYIEVSEAK